MLLDMDVGKIFYSQVNDFILEYRKLKLSDVQEMVLISIESLYFNELT